MPAHPHVDETAQRWSTPRPRISVLIPVRNGAHCLGAQLDALARQDVPEPWEVIVSDNGSTDGTRDLVLARRSGFPAALRLIDSGAHPGVSFARNAAIRAARADKIAICDADDVVGPQWLRGALDGLDVHDAVGGPLRRLAHPFDAESPLLPYESVGSDGLMGGNIAMRTATVVGIGGFDATFATYGREDFEFSVRLLRSGADLGRDDRMLLYYDLADSSWGFVKKIYQSSQSDVLIWRRHPQDFPGRQGRGFVLRRVVSLPVDLLRALRRGGLRPAARVVVSLLAQAKVMLGPQVELRPAMFLEAMPPTPEVRPPV